MGMQGLPSALKFFAATLLQVGTLVTDRYKQIDKFINKKYLDIDHCYDVWYVSKCKIIVTKNCTQLFCIIL